MKILRFYTVLICHFTLVVATAGCQSGSGSGNGTNDDPKPAIIEGGDIEQMAQLVAPAGTRFVSNTSAKLTVDLGSYGGGPAYLSVYSDYEAEGDSYRIDYGSRMLAKSFNTQKESSQLIYPQHLDHVLVQVWFYNGAIKPLTREVKLSEDIMVKDWL